MSLMPPLMSESRMCCYQEVTPGWSEGGAKERCCLTCPHTPCFHPFCAISHLCPGLRWLSDRWIPPVCPSVQTSHFFLLITFCLSVRRVQSTRISLFFGEILQSSCRPWRINKLPPDEEKCRLLLSRFPQAPECNFTLIMLL